MIDNVCREPFAGTALVLRVAYATRMPPHLALAAAYLGATSLAMICADGGLERLFGPATCAETRPWVSIVGTGDRPVAEPLFCALPCPTESEAGHQHARESIAKIAYETAYLFND